MCGVCAEYTKIQILIYLSRVSIILFRKKFSLRYYSHRTFIKTLFRLYVLADSDWYSNIHAYLTYSSHEFYTIEINIAYKLYIIHYMHIYYYNNGNSSFVYIYYVNLAQNLPTQRNAPKESKIFENYMCFIRTNKWEYEGGLKSFRPQHEDGSIRQWKLVNVVVHLLTVTH